MFSKKIILQRNFLWLCILLLTFVFPVRAANYNTPAYRAAIEDARVALPSEISKNLWMINSDNADIVWEGVPGYSRVLVVTWTGSYYDGFEGQDYQLRYGPVWVTPAGELRQWFENRKQMPTVPRVEQLLGLPSESGKNRFVEMWVDPIDLFRPSPDPEISDSGAELDFPVGIGISIAQFYRDWFIYTKANQYSDPAPYPWTRLGYTYDWGDQGNHVGLSEFVISVKITNADEEPLVGIHKVYTNKDYFQTVYIGKGSDSPDFPASCFIKGSGRK